MEEEKLDTCIYCGHEILSGWASDPRRDRENPDYFHIGCWFFKEKENAEAVEQSSNTRLHPKGEAC